MALSGTNTWDVSGANGNLKIKMDWTATQNVAGNYSDVTVSVFIVRGAYGYNTNSTADTQSLWIDGTKYTATSSIGGASNTTTQLMARTKRVYHNADGTKAFKMQFQKYFGLDWSGTWIGTQTFPEVTYTLNTIPRATTPTLSNYHPVMGETITINLPRASSAFTHAIYHDFLDGKWTLIAQNVGESTAWEVPVEVFAPRIPNATSGNGRIQVDTYNNGTFIGHSIINFTAYIANEIGPVIYIVTSDEATPNISEIFGAYVQGQSRLRLTISADGIYGSGIAAVKIVANGVTYHTHDVTTDLLKNSGNNLIYYEVTDTRGRKASQEAIINVLPRENPKIHAFSVSRANSNGTKNDEGTYAVVTYHASVSDIENKNHRSFILRYRPSGATTWTQHALSDATFSVNASSVYSGFNPDTTYEFQLYVSDYFMAGITANAILPTSFTLMNFHENGKAVAFGEASDGSGLAISLDTRFHKPPSFFARTTSVENIPFFDLRRQNGSVLGDVATGPGATGLRFRLNNGSTWTGHFGLLADGRPTVNGIHIVEAGSSSTGYFVRFYYGTQICWGSIPITDLQPTIAEYYHVMPAEFAFDGYSFIVSGRPSASWDDFFIRGTKSNTTVTASFTVQSGQSQDFIDGRFISIGRWR